MFYLIRHAESIYNIAQKKLEEQFGHQYFSTQQYLNIKFDLKFQDCGITQLGYQQTKKCQQYMADKDVQLVLVTPLRRAIITCYEIFKNHKDNPPIIVDPSFRQVLQSSCDIGSLLPLSKQQYPCFDYSLIQDIDAWYIHTINSAQFKQRLLKSLEGVPQEQRNERAKKQTLQLLKQVWDQRCKGNEGLKENMLANIKTQKERLKDLAKKYKSVAIVSHSENIKSYVGYKIKNCQVYHYKVENLYQQ